MSCLLIVALVLGDASESLARSKTRKRTKRKPEPALSSPPTQSEVTRLCKQARGVALIDADTHQPLLLYRAEEVMPPASTVKLLLLLAVAERIEAGLTSPVDTCTVTERSARTSGQRLYLRPGERYAFEDIALATAVYSANDAAATLAEGAFGSIPGALEVMNERARDLRMTHSVFHTPNGLPRAGVPADRSCAWDLALLGAEAVRHARVLDWCSNKVVSFPRGNRLLHTSNKLLGRTEGVDGLKTGFTRGAGFCFVGTAERNGRRLVCAVLGCKSSSRRWQLAEALFNYGFGRFEAKEILPEGASLGLRPIGNAPRGMAVNVVAQRALWLWMERGHEKPTAVRVTLPDTLRAPILDGESVGEVCVYVGDNLAARVPACVPDGVRAGPWYRLLSLF